MTLDTLLADFPDVTTEQWHAAQQAELRGADPARLQWRVTDELRMPSFLRAENDADATQVMAVLGALLPTDAPETRPWTEATEQAEAADERAFSEAGADPLDALSFTLVALAQGLERGEDVQDVTLGVGPSVLLEAARLRALRVLSARVAVAFGRGPEIRVHAVTSRYWMTRAAPHTNLLRATLGAFAAYLGQADTLTVRPHDLLGGPPSTHARRLAENIPRLLVHESHLTRPFGSAAYSLEGLTARIVKSVWAQFQSDVRASPEERAARVDAAAARTAEAVATGRIPLVGTNVFANTDERLGAANGASNGATPDDATPWGALPGRRAAEASESFRARIEAATSTGAPDIALLRFGDPARSAARAGFVQGVLAVAGVPTRETTDPAEAATAALVVLCADDADYAAAGPALARQLRATAAPALALAGPDEAMSAELRAAGVTTHVHARLRLPDVARTLLDAAGVTTA